MADLAQTIAPNLALRARHGFTSRAGGASTGPLSSLNLALRGAETVDALLENWRRAAGRLGAGIEAVAVLDQVHGVEVARVERAKGPLEPVARADAAWTTEAGVLLAVRVADCVPVLVAGDGVVAVAHAGWRGTAGDVAGALISALGRAGFAPGSLSAAIGPCISGAVYEVGGEVTAALRAAGLADDDFLEAGHPVGRAGRPHVDLRRAVARQLARAGVEDVWVDPRCTATDPELYSHRRDGPETGRFAGLITRAP